jgi:hypothetical protein
MRSPPSSRIGWDPRRGVAGTPLQTGTAVPHAGLPARSRPSVPRPARRECARDDVRRDERAAARAYRGRDRRGTIGALETVGGSDGWIGTLVTVDVERVYKRGRPHRMLRQPGGRLGGRTL